MRKILHIIPNLGTGGSEKSLLSLCRGLHQSSFEMIVISLKSGGKTADELKKSAVQVIVLNSSDGFFQGLIGLPKLFIALRKNILNFSPDIVHTWLTRANVIGRLAAAHAGIKNVISSLRVMEKEKNYHLWAEALTHHFCKVITVNCTALKEFAVEKIGLPENKIVLIFNGIDLPAISPPIEQTGKKEDFKIGTLGRLHKQKGIDIFLQAAKKVLVKYPQAKFFIGGIGPEKTSLMNLSLQLNIHSQVSFLGEVKNPIEFIRSLDIFVLASRWEGLPNVILEAMAAKTPVAASAVGGVSDLIEDGVSGILMHPESIESCAAGIIRFIENPELKTKVVKNAYEKVRERFSLSAMTAGYQKLYEDLLKKN